METKQIEVACPCCQSTLLVDVRTAKVMRTKQPRSLDGSRKEKGSENRDWEKAVGRVQDRLETQDDRLDAALDREKGKETRLDDLFEQAKKKLSEDSE